MRLAGKVALITGAARGQGAAEARLFAKEGASVVLTDIRDDEGEKVAAEINELGGKAQYMRHDVIEESEWVVAVARTVELFGGLHVLINNAGIFVATVIEHTPVEEWDRIMDINARGVFLGIKHAIPAMRESGGGSIVNISSAAGLVANPMEGAYTASKGAVRLMTKSAAIQAAKDGIRVNSVHPGFIDTEMIAFISEDPEAMAEIMPKIPLGRSGTSEEVARGVLFLASDEASYVTGTELVIDGGYVAQ